MKKIIIFSISFLLYVSNIHSQTGWIEYQTGFSNIINNIHFLNANTGWAVGDSIIIKSTNGGLNWVKQNFNYTTKTSFNSVKFINDNTGFVAGGHHSGYYEYYYEYIFKTTNGGINWNLFFESPGGSNTYINCIIPVDQNNIYASTAGVHYNAAYGYVLNTTNGGNNFSYYYQKGDCNAICCLNSQVVWAAFYFWTDIPQDVGFIYKTTNRGINWILQYRDSLSSATKFNSIYFVNQNTGFAVGQKLSGITKLLKTTNGGNSWDSVVFNNGKSNSIFFVNENTGWIGGSSSADSSLFAYTTNGGVNWSRQKKNYPGEVKNIFFINNLTGWATLSYSNKILKTVTGGVTSVNSISNKIPDNYMLYQNYPNPFNPSTNIRYQLKHEQFVTVKVYNILGKEIRTLVNEKQTPGDYEVSFDAYNLPSGIYFYKIETNEFSNVKRMILIK